MAGHHADLRRMADAFSHRGREHHGDGLVARQRDAPETKPRAEIGRSREAARYCEGISCRPRAAVLVVDFGVHVIGIGELDKPRGGFECAIRPGFNAQAVESGLPPRFASASGSTMNCRVCRWKCCERKTGSRSLPKGISCASIRCRRGVARRGGQHFGDQLLRDGACSYCEETNRPPMRPL